VVAAVRLRVALDLAVDGLKALPDRRGDLLDGLLGLESVGDGDAVVLGQKRGDIGPVSGTIMLPASMNQFEPS
jgi:hypothetical protein